VSHSRRRRKDIATCRGCDAGLATRDGRGRCRVCMAQQASERARRAIREVFDEVREANGLPRRGEV